jgi:hypothetical protein
LAAAAIFKNGSILHQGLNYAGATANAVSVPVAVIDVANGTDAYDVRVLGTSASTLTVNGSASNTWFCGEQI